MKSKESPRHAPIAMMAHSNSNRSQSQQAMTPNRAPASDSAEPERLLPPQDVDRTNMEDYYVQFVFYCNPSLPLSTDTAELRKGFQSMPKTDGKSFDVYTLYELIQKLETKELESWSQLVIEMGVEPPDTSKNQSTQKVGQYAVRLKRWLHAYHIDAFFQHCLGKTNAYFTDIPPETEDNATTVRDGVPPEEDLALRALVPAWRPKRGRRKLDPNDAEGSSSAKRPRRATSLAAEEKPSTQDEGSPYPQSAFPWDRQSNQADPWAAAQRAIVSRPDAGTSSAASAFWMDLPDATPSTPFPQSAVDAISTQSTFTPGEGPHSAHPLSESAHAARKRPGSSVSAAWQNNTVSLMGKYRGRPPAYRTTQNGPFSTFPSRPRPGSKATLQQITGTPTSTPTIAEPSSSLSNGDSSTPVHKPSKLQLQVPRHSGGPVRLATPPAPPKVVVNDGGGSQRSAHPTSHAESERLSNADFFQQLEEASEMGRERDSGDEEDGNVDWKRRALVLKRKLADVEAELKAVKRRVMEAIM